MATGTDVRVELDQSTQFQGLFTRVWLVHFTLDEGIIGPNANEESTVAVPGVKLGDIVLGYACDTEPPHDAIHEVHVGADDVLHIVTHNTSAGNINPASTSWHCIIARTVFHNQT